MSKRGSTLKKRRRGLAGVSPQRDQEPQDDRERRLEELPAQDSCEARFRFDPYWDEVFAAYYDPTMGTCCRR
jgi:hypothetical protein